jgi:hypothetical protein
VSGESPKIYDSSRNVLVLTYRAAKETPPLGERITYHIIREILSAVLPLQTILFVVPLFMRDTRF